MSRVRWSLPVLAVVACLGCLAAPIGLTLIGAAGVTALGLAATLAAIPLALLGVLLICLAGGYLALRRRPAPCDEPVPGTKNSVGK